MNTIGPRIRALRLEKGLSQKELTARCNLAGWDISRGTLAKIESQSRRICDDEVLYLAQALDTEVSALFNTDNKPSD